MKLLGIRSAVDAADPEAIGNLTSRYTIVVPDALTKFPVSERKLMHLKIEFPSLLICYQN